MLNLENNRSIVNWEKREWLDEKSSGNIIYIWDTKRTRVSVAEKFDVSIVFPDGTSLLDPINREWYVLILSYIYLVRDDKSLNIESASVHISVIKRVIIFLKWVRLQGIFDLRRLTPEVLEKFSAEISLGAGYALRFVDRLEKYFEINGDNLPVIIDKNYAKRKFLDVGRICDSIFITVHSLSSDKAASQLIARVGAKVGYRSPSWHATFEGDLPKPKPITRTTHSRFIEAVRYLHKWNKELGGCGLRFLPLPNKTDRIKIKDSRTSAHTKNIPPAEVMKLLDLSFSWIYNHASRVLDLFDDIECILKEERNRALSLDRWSSGSTAVLLKDALVKFLATQDSKGVAPHGCINLICIKTNSGRDIAKAIFKGNLKKRSRKAAVDWLNLSEGIDDAQLKLLVRKRLSNEEQWKSTWPYTNYQLAELIGISVRTLLRFLDGQRVEDNCLEKVEKYLISQGSINEENSSINNELTYYRMDRGIEKKIAKYVAEHPLNISTDEKGPWPLRWNLATSSRNAELCIYDALRICIPAAARILLGVFQARRESELASLTVDCISNDADKIWFESHIAKTLRRDKKLPSVKTVADTVLILKRWSERGRERNGTGLLFSHWDPMGGQISGVKPNEDINKFVALQLKMPLSVPLQIRQFRRFFAVTYMWRYRIGNLPALSAFLCHANISMTWEYVTEKVGTTVIREAQAEFSKEMLVGAALGRITLHGSFGRTWHRWIERVRAKVKSSVEFVNGSEDSDRLFMEHVEAGLRLLTPTPGGVCAAGDRERDNRRAMCRVPSSNASDRYIKKPELARPAQCASCPFSAIDDMHKDHWFSIAAEARAAANSETPSIIRERARIDAPKLERVARFFLKD